MAKDEHDENTGDLLTPVKRGRGRPSEYGFKTTSADRMVKAREKIKQQLIHQDAKDWDERTCVEAMSHKKYEQYKAQAWKQFGVINNYCHGDENN